MTDVWLLSTVDGDDDTPTRAFPSKEAAVEWVRRQDPTLWWFPEEVRGLWIALAAGATTIDGARYTVQKLPYGED